MSEMVESLTISKLQNKGKMIIDAEVWMKDYQDFDFRPSLVIKESKITVRNISNGEDWDSYEIPTDLMEVAERDRSADLKVKFQVRGMHGVLTHKHPIEATGKGKTLSKPSWITNLPISFE